MFGLTEEEEKKLFYNFLPAVMLLIIGLYFIVSTIPKSLEWNNLKKTGTLTEATILSIRKTSEVHGRSTTTVHWIQVKYTYNDKEYQGRLNRYSPELREGGTVRIIVSKNDPNKFMAESTEYGDLYVIGIILLIIGGIMAFLAYKKQKCT